MSTPSSINEDIGSLFAQTVRRWRDEGNLADNVYRDNKLTAFLFDDDDGYETIDGGERISETLLYGKNTTVQWYSGYQQLDITPQDDVSEAYYKWRNMAGSVTIAGDEERKNMGKSRIIRMLNSKRKNLEMSLKDNLNQSILNRFSPADNGEGPIPLPMLVAKDPSAAAWNPVGAIDGSASEHDFWRNQNVQSDLTSSDTVDQLGREVRKAYRLASLGSGGPPDIGITDHETWGYLEDSKEGRKRLQDDQATTDFGFDNIRVKQATVMFDEIVPDLQNESTYDGTEISKGSLFFLNTDFLTLIAHEDAEFEFGGFKEPADQDAKVGQVIWMGALISNNRRKHACLYDIPRDMNLS